MPPTTRLTQRDTVRLVPTGRLKQPALLPLAPDPGALDDVALLESATNARLRGEAAGLPDLDPRELVFGRAGQTFVNAAFTHTRPGGNRFNDDERGAWYAAFEAGTALAEVAYHLARELEAIGRFENVTDYAELLADFVGRFHDLRAGGVKSCLDPDTARGYPAGQALARRLRAEGSNGIVYPSLRRRGGTCLVAFRPDLVQNLREGSIWRLEWRGSPEPVVTEMTR